MRTGAAPLRRTFNGGTMPTQPAAWAAVGFFLLIGVGFTILPSFRPDDRDIMMCSVMVTAVVLAAIIRFWPRPRYVKEMVVSNRGISGRDRREKAFEIAGDDLELVSSEGVLHWASLRMDPWGRINMRGRRIWLSIPLSAPQGEQCYRTLVDRFPHVLGLSGDDDIDVPSLKNVDEFTDWIARVRRAARKELGRQIAFFVLYTCLLGGAGTMMVIGVIRSLVAPGAAVQSGMGRSSALGVMVLIAAGIFALASYMRWRFLTRIMRSLSQAASR